MTNYPDLFAALAAPFDPHEVKVRVASGGRQLAYITARTAMNRLDNVLGPENWWDDYVPSANSVQCRLTIRLPDGNTVTKCDAGGYAGMADQGDDDKSGFSDAFKRAAAKFGVARYLYRDGVPNFVPQKDHDNAAPEGAEPQPAAAAPTPDRARTERATTAERATASTPRSGRALFAWVKEQEQRHEVGLLKYLNGWGKLHEFPSRIVDWDADQVAQAYAEAIRKIQAIQPIQQEAFEEALSN
jgi:hypothetical protein